jgi:hypothetical protein
MRHDDRPDVTKGFDLLWNGLEVTTGAQREHRYDRLMQQAIERGYALEPLRSYLEFFRYGCPPHGGAGIGLGRLLMIILGRQSIREVTLVSRTLAPSSVNEVITPTSLCRRWQNRGFRIDQLMTCGFVARPDALDVRASDWPESSLRSPRSRRQRDQRQSSVRRRSQMGGQTK